MAGYPSNMRPHTTTSLLLAHCRMCFSCGRIFDLNNAEDAAALAALYRYKHLYYRVL